MRAGVPSGLHSRQPRAGGRARCFDGEVSVVAGFFGFVNNFSLRFFAVRSTLGGEVSAVRFAFFTLLCFVLTRQIV